ncbi:MAG: hypothetical protein JXQ67_11045 [Campylobacterales bacterium]|nr:hypothetical protein [Campylobacterales bacterium]
MQQYDIPLHDIKPIIDIEEYSLHYLLTLIGVVSIIVVAIIYLLIRWYMRKNRVNLRKEYVTILKGLDLQNTKSSAYALTLYGAAFKNDSLRHQEAYKELFEALETYKYKKDVGTFDTQTLHFIAIYQGMLDA